MKKFRLVLLFSTLLNICSFAATNDQQVEALFKEAQQSIKELKPTLPKFNPAKYTGHDRESAWKAEQTSEMQARITKVEVAEFVLQNEKDLTEEYNTLLEKMNPASKIKLREAQRKWLSERNAACSPLGSSVEKWNCIATQDTTRSLDFSYIGQNLKKPGIEEFHYTTLRDDNADRKKNKTLMRVD